MRMEIRKGIAVSPGVAIAPAIVLDSEQFRIARRIFTVTDHSNSYTVFCLDLPRVPFFQCLPFIVY
jgi:hypothetical protein